MSELKIGQRVLFMSEVIGAIPYLSYGRVTEPKYEDLVTIDFGEVGVWYCGKGELEPMKYDLEAMGFSPDTDDVGSAFVWDAAPEGFNYWYRFHHWVLPEEEAEVAQAKWGAMKKQWYEEQEVGNCLDWGDSDFGTDLAQSLKEAIEMAEGSLLVDTPEQHYTPKDIQPMDNVKHPNHYNQDGEIECIDAIKASLGVSDFAAYCKGNCMKYLWRYKYKNGIEDLEKAKVYLEWMIETMRKGN